ncbi:Cardiolipin synthase C [compost metagenome]
MHNKAMIVDNQAAILGGRNIGSEYMGLDAHFNFHDLDVLGIGPVARQASAVFDRYWNSERVVQASALGQSGTEEGLVKLRGWLADDLAKKPELARFPVAPTSWTGELAALPADLKPGTSEVYSDLPEAGEIRHRMMDVMDGLAASARRELLVVNAYIIPGDKTIDMLRALKANGVDIRVLTNSLASHDVPAVNSHYKRWRRQLVENTTALHEMRHDAAIQPGIVDTPPTQSGFVGLHSKGMVVDRERVYIGSMNFDPRSAALNTEMGVVVTSPGLADDLVAVIRRDMQPANSWRVALDADGSLTWTNDRETVTRQPARSWWQRVQDVIFMAFPKNLY